MSNSKIFVIASIIFVISLVFACEKTTHYKPFIVDGPYTFNVSNNSSFDFHEFSVYYIDFDVDSFDVTRYLSASGFYQYKLFGREVRDTGQINLIINDEYNRTLNSANFKSQVQEIKNKYTDQKSIDQDIDSLSNIFKGKEYEKLLKKKIDSVTIQYTNTYMIDKYTSELEKKVWTELYEEVKVAGLADSVLKNSFETKPIWYQNKFVFKKNSKTENITSPSKTVKFAFRKSLDGSFYLTPQFFELSDKEIRNLAISNQTYVVDENLDTLLLADAINESNNTKLGGVLKGLRMADQIELLEYATKK